ncbi:uncharacterized protein LOC130719295 [Lotus japonicus]|uniref:uncharacterized protein LOC130719295 n=1 Tax=Lotus japonicus TaxID=34305 RepID=UPI0025854A3B|nr:uncharacterized protein LOC130719295 [Lotus japonicus]
MARFSPKFNAEGDGKKRGGAESQTEGAQAPKRRKLVKVSSVAPGSAAGGPSNAGAQPTAAALSKGKDVAATATIASSQSPTGGTSQFSAAKASAATATKSALVTAPNSATAGATTVGASKSTTIGATTATADQTSTAGTTTNASQPSAVEKLAAINATTAAAPPPTNDGRSMSPPPRQEERPPPDAAPTFEAARIEQAPGNKGGYPSYYNMLPNAIEPSEFLLTSLNRDAIEKEVSSQGINETKEETLACLLRAGCIFAHTFDNFNAAAAETERLKAESAQHQEVVASWKKRFDKLLDQAGKEKVQADKLIGAAGNRIGELEDDLKLMKDEADGLDASLQACKKQKDQVEKDLAAKGEALAAKESELEILGAELQSAKKALAEQEGKSAESLASAKADLEAVMRATAEEIKKADESQGAALAARDAEITSHLARIKELESELSAEKAKATKRHGNNERNQR